MITNNYLLTVCCLTYNQDKYIHDCIDGILMQKTNFSFQILIHDDCSTDDTQEILKSYAKENLSIEIIQQAENQFSKGINPFFKYLVPNIKGKYIAICEGDDYWTDPLKLQKQVDFMENNPEYAMTFHNATVLKDDVFNKENAFSKIKNRDYSQHELFTNWIVATASMVFKNEIIRHPSYNSICNENDLMFGDNMLLMLSFLIGKVRGMDENMSVYRKHDEGISFNVDRVLVHKLNKQNILFGKYFPDIKCAIPNIISKRYISQIKIAVKSGNISDALYYLIKFLKAKAFNSY